MKNLKNFETFILENDNRTWWGNKFDNDNGVKGYEENWMEHDSGRVCKKQSATFGKQPLQQPVY